MRNIFVKALGDCVCKDALFVTLFNECGEKEFYLNGKMVSKEEGNKKYLELKKLGTEKFDVIEVNSETADGLKDWYMSGYDDNIAYIDNYRQYQSAERANREICDCVRLIDRVVKQEEEFRNKPASVEKIVPTSKEEMKKQILENDSVLYDALYKVYQCQTDSEKASDSTKEYNGVGFNGVDAPFLSSLAKSLEKYGSLTPKQTAAARKKMVKYSGQVLTLMMS